MEISSISQTAINQLKLIDKGEAPYGKCQSYYRVSQQFEAANPSVSEV
jgi:hypothetical protein